MIRLRASDLDAWVRFMEPLYEAFEVSLEDFLSYMRRETEPTDAMEAGRAFHTVLEHARAGEEIDAVQEDNWVFRFADDLEDVALPPEREEETEKVYETPSGPVLLRGRVDGRGGIEVVDYKLTMGGFDAEKYARSLQWRAYLDMTGGKRFRYLVFQAKRKKRDLWVHRVHELTFWRYPEMGGDVQRRVGELAEFVAAHVPSLVEEEAAA